MIKLHFNTDPTWIDVIRQWAATQEEVAAVWIFGSRVTGTRRAKVSDLSPDLDLAVGLLGGAQHRFDVWMSDSDDWEIELQSRLPNVTIDLQWHDAQGTDRVPSYVADHGVEIFRR